ncbi:MAG: hypothetical protein ACFE8E_11575 [Candidatus Hodarchaeota archaeon]
MSKRALIASVLLVVMGSGLITGGILILTSDQIKMIFTWLPKFRDNIMPFLAQEDQNLPMDSTTLGNVIMIGTIVPGGIFISVSITALSRKLSKKKRLRT